MQFKSIAKCSPWSILQNFWPSLSYHLSLRSLFCLFLSGHFTQVLLYMYWPCKTNINENVQPYVDRETTINIVLYLFANLGEYFIEFMQ